MMPSGDTLDLMRRVSRTKMNPWERCVAAERICLNSSESDTCTHHKASDYSSHCAGFGGKPKVLSRFCTTFHFNATPVVFLFCFCNQTLLCVLYCPRVSSAPHSWEKNILNAFRSRKHLQKPSVF